jgi:hypothetical protein
MGLSLGTLFVTLDATATGFTKAMSEGSEKLELFAKHAKKAAREVGEVGTVISALATGALAVAAKHSSGASEQLTQLERASTALALSAASALAPAFTAATRAIQGVANVFASLNPSQRAMLATIVEVAGAVAVGAHAFRILASAVQGALAIFGMFTSGIAAVGVGPLLGIIAAIAAVIAAVVLLHKIWRENWGGIQEKVRDVLDYLSNGFKNWFEYIANSWNAIIAFMAGSLQSLVDGIASIINKVADWADALGSVFDKLTAIKGLGTIFGAPAGGFHGLGAGLRGAGSAVSDVGSNVASFVGDFNTSQMGRNLSSSLNTVATGIKGAGGGLVDEAKLMLAPVTKFIEDLMSRFQGKQGVAGGKGDIDRSQEDYERVQRLKKIGYSPFDNPLTGEKDVINTVALQQLRERQQQSAHLNFYGGSALASRQGGVAEGFEDTTSRLDKAIDAITDRFPTLGLAMMQAKDAVVTFAKDMLSKAGAAVGQAAQNFAGKLGNLGSTISAGVSGAQQGGPWGAVMGVVIELFSQAKQFTAVMNAANGQFAQSLQQLGPAFSTLAGGVNEIIGAVNPIATGLHTMLAPVLKVLAGVLNQIAPLFVEIGLVFQAIAPSLQSLNSILPVLQPVFWLLFQGLKGVGLVITGIVYALETAWNAILSALVQVLGAIEQATGGTWADALRSSLAQSAVDTTATSDAMKKLLDTTYEQAQAQAQNTGAQLAAAGAAQSLANSFQQMITNAPSGFRIGGYEYAAQGDSSGATVINGDVIIQSQDSTENWQKQLKKQTQLTNYQQTGRPFK